MVCTGSILGCITETYALMGRPWCYATEGGVGHRGLLCL